MKKLAAGLVLLCGCLLTNPVYAAGPVTAQGNNTIVLVDSQAQEIYPYNIDGSNYFKLRDMAALLSTTNKTFAVEWDESKNAINLNTSSGYVRSEGDLQFPSGASAAQAENSQVALYCNGQPVAASAYNIDGSNYFKLRDIGEAVGFAVHWDEAAQLMMITTDSVGITTVAQGQDNYAYHDRTDNAIELDESFTNPDYWDSLPELDAYVEDEAIEVLEVPEEELEQSQIREVDETTTDKPANTTVPSGQVQTNAQTLLNNAALHPKPTQFGVLNQLVQDFMAQNFTEGMDTYSKVKTAYDYFIANMTYQTATQLDMSMFSKEEAAVIWQHYPERYAVPILLDHKGVCNHYSSAYAAILQAIGLDVKVVSGKTKSSAGGYSSHVWVVANIDGIDYLFDPQVEQRIAKRRGNVIQYNRFAKPMSTMTNDYHSGKAYQFADAL